MSDLEPGAAGRRMQRRAALVAASGVLLAACATILYLQTWTGKPPESPTSAFTAFDSAGVRVAINRVPSCTGESLLGIAGEPHATIPPPEDAGEFAIGFAGAGLLGDGTVAVADAMDRSLIFYDPSGSRAGQILGPGGGPGEVSGTFSFRAVAGDSLIVWDPRAQRLTVFASGGRLARTQLLSDGGGGVLPMLEVPRLWALGASQLMAFLEPDFHVERGLRYLRLRLGIRTPDGRVVRFPFWQGGFPSVLLDGRGIENPLHQEPVVSGSPANPPTLFFAPNEGSWEVRVFDSEASLVRILRADIPRVPIDAPLVDRAASQVRQRAADQAEADRMEAAYRTVRQPDSLPPIAAIVPDERGWIWVGRSRPLGQILRYDLFDVDGRWRGCVQVPDEWGTLVDASSRTWLVRRPDGPLGEQSLGLFRIVGADE